MVNAMITPEKIQNHIKHLQEKHDALDRKIITEENQYGNHEHIVALKKEKLRLKDEIAELKTKL
jgi:hypothetical protein